MQFKGPHSPFLCWLRSESKTCTTIRVVGVQESIFLTVTGSSMFVTFVVLLKCRLPFPEDHGCAQMVYIFFDGLPNVLCRQLTIADIAALGRLLSRYFPCNSTANTNLISSPTPGTNVIAGYIRKLNINQRTAPIEPRASPIVEQENAP